MAFIKETYGISHRTAQRMVRLLETTFNIAAMPDSEGINHWRLDVVAAPQHVSLSADDLATLHLAGKALQATGAMDAVAHHQTVMGKLTAQLPAKAKRRIAPDLDALLISQGLATRPQPIEDIAPAILEAVAFALKTQTILSCKYRPRSGKSNDLLLAPYGVILGTRRYLVAVSYRDGHPGGFYRYRMAAIEGLNTTNHMFTRDESFDLSQYSARAFGSYYSEDEFGPVELRFTGLAAKRALEFCFHPDQTIEATADATIVRFKAAGWVEMAWHLYQWGSSVEVLKPVGLKDLVTQSNPFSDGVLP